jgi:hypothetical protein
MGFWIDTSLWCDMIALHQEFTSQIKGYVMNNQVNVVNASIIFDREGYLPRRAIGTLPSLFEDKRWKKEFPAFNVESPLLYVQVVDDSTGRHHDGIFPGIFKPFSILSYKDKIGTDGAYGYADGV